MKRAIVVVCSWAAALSLAAAYLAIGWGIDDIAGHSAWSTWWIGVLGALGSGVFAWAVSALGAAQMNQMEPALRHSMIRQVFALGPSQSVQAASSTPPPTASSASPHTRASSSPP